MSNDKSNFKPKLEEYFLAARQEKSRLQADDIQLILHKKVPVKLPWPRLIGLSVIVAVAILGYFSFFRAETTTHEPNTSSEASILPSNSVNKADKPSKTVIIPASPTKQSLPIYTQDISSKSYTPHKTSNPIPGYPLLPDYSKKPTFVPQPEQVQPQPQPEKPVTDNPVPEKGRSYCVNMQGVHLITLSEDQYKNLGIIIKNKKLYFINFGGAYSKYGSEFSADMKKTKEMIPKGSKNKFFPFIEYTSPDTFPLPKKLTDGLGLSCRFYESENTGDNKFHANTLVPFLIHTGDTLNEDDIKHNRQIDFICWYEPSDLLFSKLPEEISQQLKNDYNIVTGFICPDSAHSSCTYFEACNNTLVSLGDINLYPNPVQSNFSISVNVEKEKMVHIGLYDINGKEVKALGDNVLLNKGNNVLHFNADGVGKGMYLVEIIAESGESAYQRLIKQ